MKCFFSSSFSSSSLLLLLLMIGFFDEDSSSVFFFCGLVGFCLEYFAEKFGCGFSLEGQFAADRLLISAVCSCRHWR